MTRLDPGLITAAAAGSPAAQECLLRVHEPVLRAVAWRCVHADYLFEVTDGLQTGRLALLACLPEFDPARPDFTGYVRVAALRACREERGLYRRGWVQLRRDRGDAPREVAPEEREHLADPAGAQGYEETLRGVLLRQWLSRLPDRERRVLCLRYGLGGGDPKRLADVAAALGVSVATAHALERRALVRLRTLMGEAHA